MPCSSNNTNITVYNCVRIKINRIQDGLIISRILSSPDFEKNERQTIFTGPPEVEWTVGAVPSVSNEGVHKAV